MKNKKENIIAHEVLSWKLKSRIDWIKHGDANTKFFHGVASARRNFNAIWALKNHEGVLVNDDAQLRYLRKYYLSSLLRDEGNNSISDQLKVIKLFPSFLSIEESTSFYSEVYLSEVEMALIFFKKD